MIQVDPRRVLLDVTRRLPQGRFNRRESQRGDREASTHHRAMPPRTPDVALHSILLVRADLAGLTEYIERLHHRPTETPGASRFLAKVLCGW